MQLSKEEYAWKRIHNGSLVQIKIPSLGKPSDTKQLPSWRNFQSALHNH